MKILTHNSLYIILTFILCPLSVSCQSAGQPKQDSKATPAKKDTFVFSLETVDAEDTSQEIDSFFLDLCTNYEVNGNILIAKNKQVIYKNSYGFANIPKKDSLHINSSFQLASVSKQFTAMAVLLCQADSLLHTSDTIQKYFPNFPYQGITIHHLLSHQSGLPEYMYMPKYYFSAYMPLTNAKLIKAISQYRPRKLFEPGEKYDYCNTGYVVLAAIVEKVSQQSFDEFVEKRIFEPLSMTNSFVYYKGKEKPVEHVALGHRPSRYVYYDNYMDYVMGDKGVYSTIEDMYRWDYALYTNQLLPDSLQAKLFTPHIAVEEHEGEYYGYGFRVYQFEAGGKAVFHTGWWHGFRSLFIRIPEEYSTVIILANINQKEFVKKRNFSQLLHILHPDKFTHEDTDAQDSLQTKP